MTIDELRLLIFEFKNLYHPSAERTQAYFDALGRSASIFDWQFRQAVDAARILACETIQVAGASPLQSVPGASRSEDPAVELTNLIDALRRAIRLKGHAVATEET